LYADVKSREPIPPPGNVCQRPVDRLDLRLGAEFPRRSGERVVIDVDQRPGHALLLYIKSIR